MAREGIPGEVPSEPATAGASRCFIPAGLAPPQGRISGTPCLSRRELGLVRGDVEVHVSQRDWEAHGHGNDPRYNGVVLHVVGDMGTGPTILRSGSRVPVLSLEQLLQSRQSQGEGPGLWSLLEAHGYSPPVNPRELGVLLDEAGDSRFLGKERLFSGFLARGGPGTGVVRISHGGPGI